MTLLLWSEPELISGKKAGCKACSIGFLDRLARRLARTRAEKGDRGAHAQEA